MGDFAFYLLPGQRGSHQVSRRALVHQAALDVEVPLVAFLANPLLLPSLTIAALPGILYETEAVPMPCTLALVQTKHGGSELVRGWFAAHPTNPFVFIGRDPPKQPEPAQAMLRPACC